MPDWSRPFDVPIDLPDGRKIVTLDDARKYLLKIPKKEWTPLIGAAIEAVIMAANGEGPMLHANAGIGQVVHGPRKRATGPRKKPTKKIKIVR
jgi:hypothetical protein